MSPHNFTCESCGGTFSSTTTDEAMEAEFRALYGHGQKDTDDEVVTLCDSCYHYAVARLREIRSRLRA